MKEIKKVILKISFVSTLLLVLLTTYSYPSPALASTQIIDLGGFGSQGNNDVANGINDNGVIVGQSSYGDNKPIPTHAFVFQNNQLVDLGTLGGENSYATAINNLGQITGMSNTVNPTAFDHVFLFQNNTMQDLGFEGVPADINDVGTIVGKTPGSNTQDDQAFLYQNGQLVNIAANFPSYSTAVAVNNSGQVVGNYLDVNDVERAYIYENGQVTVLYQDADVTSHVHDINNNGEILVSYTNTQTGVGHVVLLDNGQETIIDTTTYPITVVNTVNDSGVVAGAVADSEYNPAIYYNNAWVKLPKLLPSEIHIVSKINNNNVMVGRSNWHAVEWLFDPSAPPSPVTVTFNPTDDTYVKSGSDNRNTGAGLFMRLQSSGDNRSLVKFDHAAIQSAVGSHQVLSAKLKLTITDNGNNWGNTGRTIDVHRLLSSWSEGNGTELPNERGTGSGATWACAIDSNIANTAKNCTGITEWKMGQPNNPAVHPWAQTASDTETITNNQSGIVEFDVKNDVTAFLNGTYSDYGWLLKKTNEGQNGQVSFGTKESTAVPQLEITYQP